VVSDYNIVFKEILSITARDFVDYLILIFGMVSFLAIGIDKFLTVQGSRRIRERTLLLIALVGGFIGIWAGMLVFRHKTKKGNFVLMLGLTTFLWILIFILH
jgi:uncharacterized membrane protein YsdA (DUF1294 family)